MVHAPNREARIRQGARGTQAKFGGLRPSLHQGSHAAAARLGQRGWPTERVPSTAQAGLLPRSASTRETLAGGARRRTRSPFARLPALTTAATGAAQDWLEARGSLSGRKEVLLEEQLLLARSLRESVLEEGRARFREEGCPIARRPFPLPGAPKMSGRTASPASTYGTGAPFVVR